MGAPQRPALPAGAPRPAAPARCRGARGRAPARAGAYPGLIGPQQAVAGELEARGAGPSAGAVDTAVARLLHYEGVLGATALVRLVDLDAARDRLEQPCGGPSSVSVGAEARSAAVSDDPPRMEDDAPVALAVGVPAAGVVRAAGRRLVEDDLRRVGRVELGGCVVNPEARAGAEDAADVKCGIPLLVGRSARRCRKEPHRRLRCCAVRAVRNGLPEIGHVAGVCDEALPVAAKQPGLERVEADGAAPRRARSLVQDDHPGQTLAIAVRDEHLEARVGLVAAGELADGAEGGHSGAAEVMEGAG